MIARRARFDAAHAERLLTGSSPGPGDAVSRLLAAASAPARPAELAGEDEAVRAFHLARRTQLTPPLPQPMRHRRARWGWALLAKVVAMVLATVGAGWALAASTGVLPAPWQEPEPVPPTTVPASSNRPAGTTNPTTSEGAAPPTATDTATETATPAPPSVDTQLKGLCQAFVAQNEDLGMLGNPSFVRLVQAAGGVDQVPAYCHQVLGLPPPTPTASAS